MSMRVVISTDLSEVYKIVNASDRTPGGKAYLTLLLTLGGFTVQELEELDEESRVWIEDVFAGNYAEARWIGDILLDCFFDSLDTPSEIWKLLSVVEDPDKKEHYRRQSEALEHKWREIEQVLAALELLVRRLDRAQPPNNYFFDGVSTMADLNGLIDALTTAQQRGNKTIVVSLLA